MKHRFVAYDKLRKRAKGILFFEVGEGKCEVYDEDLETLRDFVGFTEDVTTDDNGNERRYLTISPDVMAKIEKAFKMIGERYRRVKQ